MDDLALTETERCLLDIFNEIGISRGEKFRLLEHYLEVIFDQPTGAALAKLEHFVDRIYFVEMLQEYRRSRARKKVNPGAVFKKLWDLNKN